MLEYYAKAIIRYLNGDFKLFERYKNIAIAIYEEEKNIITIGDVIPREIKIKLYEMVS